MQAESAKQDNQTKQLIEMHKKYKTRDGRPVRILCTDRKDPTLKVVYAYEVDGFEGIACCNLDGSYDEHESVLDLIEVRPWDDFKIDDPVLVSDDGLNWSKRYFAGVNSNGLPTAFNDGTTSFTVPHSTHITEWDFCKKPDQE